MDLGSAVVVGLARTWGSQMSAFGSREGAPFLVSYSEEGEPREALLPGRGSVTSVAGWERTLVVTHDGERCQRYDVSTPERAPLSVEPDDCDWTDDALRGLDEAKRVWVACGDEDPVYVALDDHGWLRGMEFGDGDWMPGAGLRLGSPDQLPLVNQGDSRIHLAGRFSSPDVDPSRPTMWMLGVLGDGDARQINADVRFTEISDISDGQGAWFAGSLDGRPQLVSSEGDLGPAPPVDLDPIAPTVLVATSQYDHDPYSLRLVLQTVDGIQLWTSTAQGWLHQDLPGHVLRAARYDDASSSLWFIADDQLWRLVT